MTIEKRFHQRIDIEADVDIHILHRDRHIMAKAENITPYGMLLSTESCQSQLVCCLSCQPISMAI